MRTLTETVPVRWPPDLLHRIDVLRGRTTRSEWIRSVVERELEREQAPNGHPPKEHQ